MASVARWCCCGANPCVSGDPPMDVTVSWTSNPASNTGWEATASGKLDMLGQTWGNGETKEICPTFYTYSPTLTYGVRWTYQRVNSPTLSNTVLRVRNFAVYGGSEGYHQEIMQTIDGRRGSGNALYSPAVPTSNRNTVATSGLSAHSNISMQGAYTGLQSPFDFDEAGGSITTNETVTISWSKSEFFP